MQNQRAIFLLFLANTISGVSQGICMIAIPWYFTAVLGFQTSFGLFYGILTLGSTFWSIYAGTLIDKYDRKKIQIIYSILGFIIMIAASISGHIFPNYLWVVSGIVFAFTVLLYNVHYMNIYSFAQEMTPKHQYNKVISYLEVQGQATTIFGGAMAAILMEGSDHGFLSLLGMKFNLGFDFQKWSLVKIFALDAITYFIAIGILVAIKYIPISVRIIELESAWERVKTGWKFLKGKPALLIIGWTSSSVFICVLLISFFLMPSYVSLVLQEKSNVFASSELYFAFGALLAGFIARYFLISKHEVTRILVLFGLAIIVFLVFIFNTNLAIFYAANILFGFANAAIRFNRVSYFWKLIPNHLIGRASSVINISSYVLRAFWGFLFSLPVFYGREGIILVMIVLLLFIVISGIIINIYSQKIKSLEI